MSARKILVLAGSSLLCNASLTACGDGFQIASCTPTTGAAGERVADLTNEGGSIRCLLDGATLRTRIRLVDESTSSLEVGGRPATRAVDGSFELDLAPAVLAAPFAPVRQDAITVASNLPLVTRANDSAPVTSMLRVDVDLLAVQDYFASATRGAKLATNGTSAATLWLDGGYQLAVRGAAATFGDIRYVATSLDRVDSSTTCGPYQLLDGHTFMLTLNATSSEVVVYDTRTGTEVDRQGFASLGGQVCPDEYPAPADPSAGVILNAYPDKTAIEQWLSDRVAAHPR